MTVISASGFLYLNRANTWPGFELHNLVSEEGEGTMRLDDTGAQRGLFCAGPVTVSDRPTHWHRLQIDADPLSEGCHVQLFVCTAATDEVPVFDLTADEPFPDWYAIPGGVLDALIRNEPAPCLWIGGVLRHGGLGSPRLHQIRVDYGREGYLSHMPALYGRDPERADFLDRLLALDESVLGGLDDAIGELPLLFDALAAPGGEFPSWLSWLSWLADWQAFELSELWQEEETRRYLGEAFSLHGKRGTVEGLQRYLKLYAGVEAHIYEPALHTHLWSLGETSTLGFTTMLAPAHLQGAVVGTTATLDQSHLTRGEAFGEALFDDLAHHFCVGIYCAELIRPGALDDVRAVLELEKPAHSTYELWVIKPQLRVGSQARVGIDAIVATAAPAAPAAQIGMPLGTGVLAAEPQTCVGEPVLSVDEEDN